MRPPARLAGALAGVALLAAQAAAQPAGEARAGGGTGAEAFARRDFAAAEALWRDEAAAGSARAKLGLGLIADLGLGVPRDPARALRWYLEAAGAGLAEAQFNVGVMLDAGAGVARDPAAAAVWYGRAAAGGHRRAQYNLGLLYEAGEGVPRNPDLARHWLGLAGEDLEAARERLGQLAPATPDERATTPPAILADALVAEEDGARRAELVWTAPPGPEGAPFLVEILRLPEAGEAAGRAFLTQETDASALAARLPSDGASYAWRASRLDRNGGGVAHYAASPWRRLDAEAGGALPEGRVTVRLGAGDEPAHRLAEEVERSLAAAGLWVRTERLAEAPPESAVRYAYAEDRDLAEGIAEFLPVLERGDAAPAPDLGAAPGEVVVWLVGGPDEA